MKILFTDNSLWGLLNFRGCIITHLRDLGHEVVMVSPVDASSKGMSAPEGVRHIPIRMRRTSTNPLHDVRYFSVCLVSTEKSDRIISSILRSSRIYTVHWRLVCWVFIVR